MPDYRVRILQPHAKQLLFLRSKAKYRVVRAGRRGGKTTAEAIYSVEEFLKGNRILYGVPTGDQITRFWAEVCNALAEPINAGVYKKYESDNIIELPGTEQRIRAKTAWNANTLRGDYADRLILDEFQLMSEDTWDEVGRPMLIDNNGDAMFVYTPPSLASAGRTKAKDPRNASKMFAAALLEMEAAAREGRLPRWEAFHFTSLDNPYLSQAGLEEAAAGMTELAYRQEILAEENDDPPGALWKRANIDNHRWTEAQRERFMPVVATIYVGVDPPGGATECGIVAAGKGRCYCKGLDSPEEHMIVLEDGSLKAPPHQWATRVNDVYTRRLADRVLGEKNFGGDMVEATIRSVNAHISYKNVHASRGKAVRAEPVAAKYEQGKVHHVGTFPGLENEMCGWIPGKSTSSPNRMDALVWCGRELMPDFNWEFT